jgi:GNAT superfamily N-acetyltransferase
MEAIMSRMPEVKKAGIADLEILVPLFDAYRQFYRKPTDLAGSRRFLRERLENDESVVLVVRDNGAAVGFTQLFPSFSSAAMAPIFILNDLFVVPEARRRGLGSALLQAAADYGRSTGAVRLVLFTELTNTTAQSLYERMNWKRDRVFCVYELAL